MALCALAGTVETATATTNLPASGEVFSVSHGGGGGSAGAVPLLKLLPLLPFCPVSVKTKVKKRETTRIL